MKKDFYRLFEERFRGSRELIKSRLQVYKELVNPISKFYQPAYAIDLGCGRGEWLELLNQFGFDAQGVDLDDGMLSDCRSLGLKVENGDALSYLKSIHDESQTIISGFHLVEHITFDTLLKLVDEIMRVLKPGGLMILETPNPENIVLGASNFYLDPTHIRPIPPQLLAFIAEYTGFKRHKIMRLQEQNIIELNISSVLTGVSPDYSLIAQKDGPHEIFESVDIVFESEYGQTLEGLTERYQRQNNDQTQKNNQKIDQKIGELERQMISRFGQLEQKIDYGMIHINQKEINYEKIEEKISQIESKIDRALYHTELVINDLKAIYGSRSWLITSPLRQVSGFFRWVFSGGKAWFMLVPGSRPRRVFDQTTKKLISKTINSPKKRALAKKIFSYFPQIEAKIRNYYFRPFNFNNNNDTENQNKLPNWTSCIKNIIDNTKIYNGTKLPDRRLTLAYVSPMPPERSGISKYSIELVKELKRHYEITIIIEKSASISYHNNDIPWNTEDWFISNHDKFDRVLYHFGNSHFHTHMFNLIERIPGVVTLHDFFVSDIHAHFENDRGERYAFCLALYRSHGYSAVKEYFKKDDMHNIVRKYPSNLPILQNALSIIIHSQHSFKLSETWYSESSSNKWAIVPHLREEKNKINREFSRNKLGIKTNEIIICSFGVMGKSKCNERLLDSMIASKLFNVPDLRLVYVGKNDFTNYGNNIREKIKYNRLEDKVKITDWADESVFESYLAAADIAVQLRTDSRGESSGTVLDCMAHGLPTIVNAHGSMAELDSKAVWLLPDLFSDKELAAALETLVYDPDRRDELRKRALAVVKAAHCPASCAAAYTEVIEKTYKASDDGWYGAIRATDFTSYSEEYKWLLAADLAKKFPPIPRNRQILVDVSTLIQNDLRTGIERVVRAILREWLDNPPPGWRIEPIYATGDTNGYRYARHFTSRFLSVEEEWAIDAQAEAWKGDIFFGLDFAPHVQTLHFLPEWHNRGVKIWFLLHDLLPVTAPQFFPEGAADVHQNWLETISRFDGIICVSQTVADEMRTWRRLQTFPLDTLARIDWVHNGANIDRSVPTMGLPVQATSVLAILRARTSFLMVGTIEPRKGHLQTIKAFDQLWAKGVEINLVIVGGEGWKSVPDVQRRTVPLIIETLRNHPELGRRLFWLEGISDEYLEMVYGASTCLIASSEGEGFGLPLIEAAQHGLPILARDIPVFREVAGDHAIYFSGSEAMDIAIAIEEWLDRSDAGNVPSTATMPWQTWAESAEKILTCIGAVTAFNGVH